MASVFQVKGRDGKPLAAWRFKYRGADGRWHYGIGWPGKKKTLLHALAVEAEARAIRVGEKEAPKSFLAHRNRPIAEIAGEYLTWGRTQGGRGGRPWDDQNAALKASALEWWTRELGLTLLSDIDLPRVEKCIQALLAAGKKPKTVSLRVEALRSLLLWSIRRGYLGENPLAGMARLDTRPVSPHRPLTPEEIGRLLRDAPAERRLWYETALATGFRVNELRCLRVKDLDVFGPSLFLEADYSKDRKEHRQPITRGLCEKLKPLAQGRAPDEALLGIPLPGAHKGNRYDPAGLIGRDFVAAGIALDTGEGRATWHSLRKSFVNSVVRSGADLKTVQTLARHSTAQLSMEVYASADPARLRDAAEAAEGYIREAVERAACCTGVARKAAGAEGQAVSASGESRLRVSAGMGDTGFEPVTPTLSR